MNLSLIRRKKQKVFCIGFNKTGTTSIEHALKGLHYRIGKQADAELMLHHWAQRNFQPIIRYCHSADAFQDIPFSLAYTYQAMDQAFPGSKFILTLRRSSEEWFDSLVSYHGKLFSDGATPTIEDLANAGYRRPGWIKEAMELMFDYPTVPLYDREKYIQIYEAHNRSVIEYFKYRKHDLLILDLSEDGAYQKFTRFLGHEDKNGEFPWLLKSRH
jgi:hypothetical protein